jgi:HlyD family secretion protein
MRIYGIRTIQGLAILTVSAWVLAGCGSHKKGESSAARTGAPKSAEVITVQEMATPMWLEATGSVKAEFEASLSAKLMGRVTNVSVREGDMVRKGQTLVRLEANDLSASVDMASANLKSSMVAFDNSRTVAAMEVSSSAARIAQANAALIQADAAVGAAKAKLQLVESGPRRQEKTQAMLAVKQADANLKLAQADFNRMKTLYEESVISRRQFDSASAQLEVAKAQYETAVQSQSIADEGSRTEDIREARESLRQAKAAYQTAQAGVAQAKASAMQATVRRKEINSAQAQINQSKASLRLARVNESYSQIVTPFDGVVSQRSADPGTMASPGMTLIKVEGGQLRLEAIVPESALKDIKKGDRLDVLVDAIPDRSFTATIAEIRPQGDPATHTFLVRATLPQGVGILSGMFGRARFPVGVQKQIVIPSSATWEREGLHYVFIVNDQSKAELRLITVGDATGRSLVVLSGLNPGEKVILKGRDAVREGDIVEGRN